MGRIYRSLFIFYILLLVFSMTLLFMKPQGYLNLSLIPNGLTMNRFSQPRTHLIVPANKANHRLCRTLASAMLNDYPPPTLLNWGLNRGDAEMNGYDMTTGKIWGVLKYLRSLPRKADKDIVIMVDAHDVVFQLPLDILLRRYHAINEHVDLRLTQQHTSKGVIENNLAQTILAGAEKHCWPLDHRHPACYAVPESPLPANIYGEKTDYSSETTRPRWMNSGTIVGPVRDMRVLYEWTHSLWRAYATWAGDQDYFSYIYGMQELGRQSLRGSQEWVFGFNESFTDKEFIATHLPVEHTDYHLGLDLESQVFHAVSGKWGDLAPIIHNNVDQVDEEDRIRGTRDVYQERFLFPAELDEISPPFHHLVRANVENTAEQPEVRLGWRNVSLFSNFHARSIPVAMHFNGDKSKLDQWWGQMWWKGHGRDLKDLKLREGRDSWASIKTDSGHRLQWQDICAEHEGYLFGD